MRRGPGLVVILLILGGLGWLATRERPAASLDVGTPSPQLRNGGEGQRELTPAGPALRDNERAEVEAAQGSSEVVETLDEIAEVEPATAPSGEANTTLELRLLLPRDKVGVGVRSAEPPFVVRGEPSWVGPITDAPFFGSNHGTEGGEVRFLGEEDGRYVLDFVRPGVAFTVSAIDAFGSWLVEEDVLPLEAGEHRIVELVGLPLLKEFHGRGCSFEPFDQRPVSAPSPPSQRYERSSIRIVTSPATSVSINTGGPGFSWANQ